MILGLGKEFAVAIQSLRTGVPVVQISGLVIALALKVFLVASDQAKKLEKEIRCLKETVDKYKDLREIRGEQRKEFIRALDTVEQSLDQASRFLPQAAQEHSRRVQEHHIMLCDMIDSVESVRARYEVARRFGVDLTASLELAEEIKANIPIKSFKALQQNLRKVIEHLRKQKEM